MNRQAVVSATPVRLNALLGLAYSGLGYVLFLGAFTAFALAVTGLWTPWAERQPMPWVVALLIDVGLVGAFALQHSVMARSGFKTWWTRVVPAHLERSTFVWIASLLMLGLVFLWQPLSGELWSVEAPWLRLVLRAGFVAGYLGVVACSFLIDHFYLFGLRQSWRHAMGQDAPVSRFREPWAYRRVRHPMMTAVILMMWSTPDLSASRALMAGLFTLYTLAGVLLEERELSDELGAAYSDYRQRVRWKIVPGLY